MPSYRRLEVHTATTDFRAATHIVEVSELPVATPRTVVVKNHFVGVNAADVHITNGEYSPHGVPFGCGADAVGEVIAIGDDVDTIAVGDAVAYQSIGAFAEYHVVPAAVAVKVPSIDPSVLPVLVGGSCCSVALHEVGHMKSGEIVLVTAAAGGTGQFAVQLAKLAGNHVIGTTSSDEKAEVLMALGCDRVVNYSKESIDEVLKTEYPKGVDLVFETVGGDTLKAAVQNIAVRGRVVVFGSISGYVNGHQGESFSADKLVSILFKRGGSIHGCSINNYREFIPAHSARLFELVREGKLKPGVDKTLFQGLESIADAVDYMFARKNIGKLVVKLV